MSTVKFRGESDFTKIERDYQKLAQENAKLKEQVRQVGKESEDGSRKASAGQQILVGALRRVGEGITNQLNPLQLLGDAWRAAKETADSYHKSAKGAADFQIRVGAAQAELATNLGDITPAQAALDIQKFQDVATRAKFPDQAQFFSAAAGVRSAVGDTELTQNILAQTAPLFRLRPQDLGATSSAVGDLATIANVKQQEDIRRLIGLVITAQSEARITSLSAFKNVAPAVAAAASVDTSPDRLQAIKDAAAAFAAIGGGLKDPEGSITKTAESRLAVKLAELLPERDIEIGGEVVRGGTGMTGLAQRIAAVQRDRALQEEFFEGGEGFDKATFEVQAEPIIRQLLTDPSSEVARRFAAAQANIKLDASAVDRLEQRLNASEALRGAQRSADVSAFGEGASSGMSPIADIDRIKKINEEILKTRNVVLPVNETIRAFIANIPLIGGALDFRQIPSFGTPEDAAKSAIHEARRGLEKMGLTVEPQPAKESLLDKTERGAAETFRAAIKLLDEFVPPEERTFKRQGVTPSEESVRRFDEAVQRFAQLAERNDTRQPPERESQNAAREIGVGRER